MSVAVISQGKKIGDFKSVLVIVLCRLGALPKVLGKKLRLFVSREKNDVHRNQPERLKLQ